MLIMANVWNGTAINFSFQPRLQDFPIFNNEKTLETSAKHLFLAAFDNALP